MNELKFNSQICTTKEQSQRLLDLGLKPETADCCLDDVIEGIYSPMAVKKVFESQIPAWSLHRLMEIGDFTNVGFLNVDKMYECCITMLEGQIRGGIINKKYLK